MQSHESIIIDAVEQSRAANVVCLLTQEAQQNRAEQSMSKQEAEQNRAIEQRNGEEEVCAL